MSKDIEKTDSPGRDKLPELVDQLPPEDRAILKEALDRSEGNLSQLTTIFSAYSGPLPPPEQLEAYQRIEEEFPVRIIRMAEKEQSHRHTMEKRVLQNTANFEKRGQLYTLLISVAIVSAGSFMAFMGHMLAGFVLVAAPIAGLAAQLISGRRKNKQQETG